MFYQMLAATASRLIAQYGMDVDFIDTSAVSIDPVTGAVTGSNTTTTVKGILKTFPESLKTFPDGLIEGTRISSSMKMLVIDGSYKPKLSDKVTLNSEDWQVVSVKESSPAGVDLTYMVVVDK